MSGKLRTADTTVSHRVTWHCKVIYSPSDQPAIYNQLPSMAFVNSYLTVMFREPPHIKALMLNHLQELIEEVEHYGWPMVRAYHATWLQHIEHGRVAWGDTAVKLKLHLPWCGIMSWPPQTLLRPTQPPHSWPVPTNLAKLRSGSRQPHPNHRHNRPVQFSMC